MRTEQRVDYRTHAEPHETHTQQLALAPHFSAHFNRAEERQGALIFRVNERKKETEKDGRRKERVTSDIEMS